MVRKAVVLGARGSVAFDVIRSLQLQGWDVYPFTKEELDVSDLDQANRILADIRPSLVVNAAAFMNADRCEQFPLEAYKVNALGARNISKVCESIGAVHVWFSSDFVFDGQACVPYTEKDNVNPLMIYGITKAAGEMEIRTNCSKFYIIRTSCLFGAGGSNFIERMIAKAVRSEPISIVDDILISPCYTKQLSDSVAEIVKKGLPYGVYHVVNGKTASWFELCKEAFAMIGIAAEIQPIQMRRRYEEDHTLARRPLYTAMESIHLKEYGIVLDDWRTALNLYLNERRHIG